MLCGANEMCKSKQMENLIKPRRFLLLGLRHMGYGWQLDMFIWGWGE